MLINLIEQNKREEEWNERDKLAYMLSAYIHMHGIQKGCHRYDSTDNNTQRNQYVSFSQKLSAWHIEREATPEKLNMQVNRAHYKRSIRQVNITPSKWKKILKQISSERCVCVYVPLTSFLSKSVYLSNL